MDKKKPDTCWTENDSDKFIDFGKYYIPDRDLQINTISDLIPKDDNQINIVELCCGEGLLANKILETHKNCTYYAFDGSKKMVERARLNLVKYSNRFHIELFDLFSHSWRAFKFPVRAFVSSLAIHHLNNLQKEKLYQDIYNSLETNGIFIIADLIQPTSNSGLKYAGDLWDDIVRSNSLELDKNMDGFNFFIKDKWNLYKYPDTEDKPSRIFDQLKWLEKAGFKDIDVYWMKACHAIFGGTKY